MERILDFSTDLDVGLLDQVVHASFNSKGGGQEASQSMALNIINQFRDHPEAWKRVDGILERSQMVATKFLALTILENLIKTMWKALPNQQREGIKNFVVAVIIKTSSDETALVSRETKPYLQKLNVVLVQILKQEWPQNWPAFIPEIVNSSKSSLSLCENNMMILKLLSEEIFDYSAEQMTQQKTKNLKNTMCQEFSDIFQLCQEVLDKATKPSLIKATLETLLRFLNWIPLGYIFETHLIDILRTRFLEVPEFRNVTLKCLTEIGALQVGPEYNDKFVFIFSVVVSSISKTISVNTDLAQLYEDDGAAEEFIQNVAMFLTSFLGAHLKIIEASGNRELLIQAHAYLIRVSLVRDREIFKTCLEYWSKLVAELYEEIQQIPNVEIPLLNLSGIGTSAMQPSLASYPLRKHIYTEILQNLRMVMIERMVKPEEVLIVQNDEGEIVREVLKESDTITLYKSMREVLVYLTHLDMDGSEWSWDNLNKLAWAIGSISGAMNEETEKRFLVNFIKFLLGLCEMKRGKDNKAVVASNIMYIVGQYPRFLKAHWKFLKTVVNKLFEFMHETHDGVQDMACDTFIKISQKCKRQFVMQQSGELMPFIEEILGSIDQITSDLVPHQVHTFYEAVGYMISAQPNKVQQERLIAKLMELPNNAWDNMMEEAQRNPHLLNSPESVKILGNILKTNVAACSSVGAPFLLQINKIYWDLLELYKAVSNSISEDVAQMGLVATHTPRVRGMRTIKKEVLKLVEVFISKADDLNALNTNMMPPLLESVLGDYARNVEQARDAEVLNLMAGIITRLGDTFADRVRPVLDAVFECTLNMINKDFENFPEHRSGFFKLMFAINMYCFPALLKLPAPQFKLFLDSIVWGFKHTMRDISDLGLTICLDIITNFTKSDTAIANAFFQTYYLSILQDIFFVLTNTFHKSGFKLQSLILAQMFQLVDSGQISAPLFNPATVTNPNLSNSDFLREHVMGLLQAAFPHLQQVQVRSFVLGLFEHNKDLVSFKMHLRDFLITLKEFQGDDNSDLFLEEREAEAQQKKDRERAAALRIPGMVKPHDSKSWKLYIIYIGSKYNCGIATLNKGWLELDRFRHMNGQAVIVPNRAGGLANYPHARRVNGFIYVSGISSRRFDNTWEAADIFKVVEKADGAFELDIKAQTKAVIQNIEHILKSVGAGLGNLVDLTVFLVDMEHYQDFNDVYNTFFTNAETGTNIHLPRL
ncbi:Karyopherin transporter [Irineochytrium annulatum]|nr:Karyopherin transporter [Irineochytrium annulatum]